MVAAAFNRDYCAHAHDSHQSVTRALHQRNALLQYERSRNYSIETEVNLIRKRETSRYNSALRPIGNKLLLVCLCLLFFVPWKAATAAATIAFRAGHHRRVDPRGSSRAWTLEAKLRRKSVWSRRRARTVLLARTRQYCPRGRGSVRILRASMLAPPDPDARESFRRRKPTVRCNE
jgi:hypothetical protein